MAGDWIKIEHSLPDKPEVMEMASILGIDADAVVGKLIRVWTWFDNHTDDGDAPVTVRALLNRCTGVSDFVSAMEQVGWITDLNGRLNVSRFDRHNGQTAKTRANTNRRVAKSRNGNGASVTNVTGKALQKPLPEKRREESPILTNRSGKCTLDEAKEFAREIGLPESDGESCFFKWEGNGWKNGTNRVKDWKATMRSWKSAGYMPSQKQTGQNHKETKAQQEFSNIKHTLPKL
jgi:hypothetical protein